MKPSVPRRDLGERLAVFRDFYPKAVARMTEKLGRRPMLDAMVTGFMTSARELLGYASWFDPESRLMLDSARLQGQATLGYSRVMTAASGETVQITLGGAAV